MIDRNAPSAKIVDAIMSTDQSYERSTWVTGIDKRPKGQMKAFEKAYNWVMSLNFPK